MSDAIDLEVFMQTADRFAHFVARKSNNTIEAADFLERVSKACAEKAAEYRAKP